MSLKLGARNSSIYSESPALIDARGELKPEVSPARTTPEQTQFDRLPGWQRLNDAFKEGQGLLAEKLAGYLQLGMTGEVFWKLCVVRYFPTSWIPHKTLWSNLSISLVEGGKQGEWQLVRELGALSFKEESEDGIVLCDGRGKTVGPDITLDEWERSGSNRPQLCWRMNVATILMCSFDIENTKVVLTPRPPINGSEILGRYYGNGVASSTLYADYVGFAQPTITVETPIPTANRTHPLSKIALDSRYVSQQTDLQRFAHAFVPFIAGIVSRLELKLCLENPVSWQKRIGHLYFDVEWSKYDPSLRAPYVIWTKETGFTSLTDDEFAKWRDASVEDRW